MSVGLSGEDTATLGIDALRGIQVAREEQPDLQFSETVFPLQLDTQDTACGTEGGAATAEYFTADARVAGAARPIGNVYGSLANLPQPENYDAAGYSRVSPGRTSSARYEERFGEAPVSHVHGQRLPHLSDAPRRPCEQDLARWTS